MTARRVQRLIAQLDWHWTNQLRPRLSSLVTEEYLWEPVPGCWSLRRQSNGKVAPDWAYPQPDPAPLTTIAWRLGHIGQTLAQRANFHFGDRTMTIDHVRGRG